MGNFWKKKWFWISVFVLFIIGMYLILSRETVDGTKGGKLEGRFHRDGGIEGVINGSRKTVEMEKGEYVLTKNVGQIKTEYVCEGTPAGIASSVNQIGGGVKFDRNGNCRIK